MSKKQSNKPKPPRPKRKKRAYRKKRLLTQDQLWKLIIGKIPEPCIRFFFPEWVDKIDFSRPFDMLDKELKRLLPKGKTPNRIVDVLMRVYLKNGETKSFLIHIEVQSYFEAIFPKRVYQYHYRISDTFGEPIETLAIMIDNNPNYRPTEHLEVCGQTGVRFWFRLFKLLDNPPPYVGKEDNVFSLIMETAWYALEKNMLNDDNLERLKRDLIRRLVNKNVSRDDIYIVFDFINLYLPFADKKKTVIFEQSIEPLIYDDIMTEPMTIREFVLAKVEKEAIAKTRKEMRKEMSEKLKAQQTANILKMYAENLAADLIATLLTEPLEFVLEVIEKHKKQQTNGVA